MESRVSSFFRLTKPSIMLLVLAAGATALFMEGSLLSDPLRFAAFMVGLFLTGGCANALNQYFEREIDAMMIRTCRRRPLPMKELKPRQALIFSIVIGVLGILILSLVFNPLTGVLAFGTILFYSLVYTLWLKPRTSQNIVIGGLAGAMAPIGAWTAATGTIALQPGLLALVIFLWTPPHFWSLSLCYEDDYHRTGLPMLPVVKGADVTLNRILFYSLILAAASILLLIVNFGWIYMLTVTALGSIFVIKSYQARRRREPQLIWGLFRFSVLYLFAVFFALIIDSII